MLGTAVEYYDLTLYWFMTPTLIKLFIPTLDQTKSYIALFLLYSVGLISRPIGSIVIGNIGDTLGRKPAITLSLTGATICTSIIGLLPTYESIGILASVLLILCRFLQGFFIGGGYNGGAIFILEHINDKSKGWVSGIYNAFTVAGIAAAYLVSIMISYLPDEYWRISFFLSLIPSLAVVFLVRTINESPEFSNSQKSPREPLFKIVKNSFSTICCAIAVTFFFSSLYHMSTAFLISYLPLLTNVQSQTVKTIDIIIMVIYLFLQALCGRVGDIITIKRTMLIAASLTIILSYPIFTWLEYGSITSIVIGKLIFAFLTALFFAPFHAWIQNLFNINERYRLISLCYSIGSQLGGLMPWVGLWLWHKTKEPELPSVVITISAIIGSIGIIAINKNKKIEDELRKSLTQANNANNAKTEFLTNMSHEIRTPMNAIIGLGTVLLTQTSLNEKQTHYLKILLSSANSLLGIINQMLEISKIENKTLEISNTEFDLFKLFETVYDIGYVKAKDKNICLLLDFNKNLLPQYVLGDETRIQQILTNLTDNAIKFTEEGYIKLSVNGITNNNKVRLKITISDTGIGIKQDKLETIFDRFVQADSSINRKYGGTGLGLSICKELINLMNGNLSVTSKEGSGSEFVVDIELPIASKIEIHPVAKSNNSIMPSHNKKILIVEDNSANLLVLQDHLQFFDYSYIAAVDGYEALERVKEHNFSLILMDIQMNGIDGFMTTKLIRNLNNNSNKDIPIIALTAHAINDYKQKCLENGMNDYLSKPFTAEQLKEKLDKWHDIEKLDKAS
jgi:signal transduction histidine kinase/CheY-like chemotaxis protein